MKSHSSLAPERIGFNAIDRMFLVPESDDPHGTHFPMSTIAAITLKHTPEQQGVVSAIRKIERKFPQFRLGYTLDYEHNRWLRVPADQLDDHLASLIQILPPSDLADLLSSIVRTNNVPFSNPFVLILHGNDLIIKMHHSFGDGRFMLKLLNYFVRALHDPDGFERLPTLAMHFSLPLWRIFAATPKYGLGMVAEFLRGLTGFVGEYKRDMASPTHSEKKLTPNVSGAEMIVRLKTISPASIKKLDDLRKSLSGEGVKISLNTLVQVLVASRLNELGLLIVPPVYTILVDLHRYLPDPSMFYPGNLIQQIMVTGKIPINLRAECVSVQSQIAEKLNRCGPLATLPGEWLLAMAGRRAYKRIYRDWMLASINTDPRYFILSNLGSLDEDFADLGSFVDLDRGVYAGTPLMGGPPLVLAFSTVTGQGNLMITYNPQVLTDEKIDSLLTIFENEPLSEQPPEKAMV